MDRRDPRAQAVHWLADEHIEVAVVVEVSHRGRLDTRLARLGHRDAARAVAPGQGWARESEDPHQCPARGGHDLVGRHARVGPVEVADGERPLDRAWCCTRADRDRARS